jgi:hypothetical protein
LERRTGNAAADGDVLRGLKIGRDPDDLGKLRTQAVDDLGRVDSSLAVHVNGPARAAAWQRG